MGLANEFRAGIGLPSGNPAIISAVAEREVSELMHRAGIIGSVRANRLRLALPVVHQHPRRRQAIDILSGHLHP